MELQGSDPELNPFIDEGSEICGFVELCISGPRAYGRDCVVHVTVDNKWGTAASGTASPLQPSQAPLFILLN